MIQEKPGRRRTVVQVTWSLVAGGMEMYAVQLAANLDRSRFRAVLCPSDKGGALEPEVQRLGIPYFIMNRRGGLDTGLPLRFYRVFRRERADIVHTHHFAGLLYGVVAARLAGARVVHTEHSLAELGTPRRRFALGVLSSLCDRIVAVGATIAEVLHKEIGIPKDKIEIIPGGVDPGRFQEPREDARREFGLSGDERVAVIVARLFPEKNHALLLDAFADVVQQVPRARLLVVGDGIEEDAIRGRIESLGLGSHVRMLGVRHDIPRILAASDVFILSSLSEGLPIALIEAMTAGLPAVSTRVGNVAAVMRDGETGYLVPSGERQPMAEAIAKLFLDPASGIRMGEKGRLAAAPFSLPSMVERYQTIYDTLA